MKQLSIDDAKKLITDAIDLSESMGLVVVSPTKKMDRARVEIVSGRDGGFTSGKMDVEL